MSPYQQRINIPIQHVSNNIDARRTEPYRLNSVYTKDTTTQWIPDSITDREIFRIKINIDGFHKNDVHVRVDGSKLYIYGERIENKTQGTSKKIIEKSYELPADVDKSNPHISYPSSSLMQVDFPAKHPSRKISTNRRIRSPEIEQFHENRTSALPIHRVSINSRDSNLTSTPLSSPVYKFPESTSAPTMNKAISIYKQTANKIQRRRATPIVGFQPSSHGEQQRSMTPALSSIIEEDPMKSSSSSDTESSISNPSVSYFPSDFNSEAFYKSIFQPEIFTDDRHQRYIEMRLDVQNHKQDDIKVSINGNDLVVHAENTDFYRQITLPSNTDLSSLSIHHHHDKKLYITVKLLDAHSSFRYI
ncbi:unnamed protein product [Adineta ricciae]|uniref:SHSP domain-containing protein n=1 Tax=Adineta ricciae TaxID=249248 RepID=A0A815P653_ADIRI|nr:unnamed protein product [Adineta ricciae]CAF1444728.1 unnamed protein product [Adineta ricciae]